MNVGFHQVLPLAPQPPTKTTHTGSDHTQYAPGRSQQPWFYPTPRPRGRWVWIPECPGPQLPGDYIPPSFPNYVPEPTYKIVCLTIQ